MKDDPLFRELEKLKFSRPALSRSDGDVEESEYGSVAFSIVDVSEGRGSDKGPHCCNGKLVRQMKSLVTSQAAATNAPKAQRLTALPSVGPTEAHGIPREIAPTPIPLILNQGSGPLQNLNFNRFRHGNSPLR